MCKSIPLEAPWEAKNADKWDQITLAKWLAGNTRVQARARPARDRHRAAVTPRPRRRFRCYSRSTRWRRAADRRFVLGVKDGAQDSRIVGGMGAVYAPMAAEIGDSLHLSQPVRRIDQDADGVTVRSDDMAVRARRVIVAVPIAIASQILYEPMLPVDRSFLHQRMPSGAIYKINIVYDEPFWRGDGLSGQSAAPGSPATVTIDASTDAGTPGVLCVIVEGPIARRIGELDAGGAQTNDPGRTRRAVRRQGCIAGRLHRANWTTERYSGGGMLSHAPPGVLTEFGPALREPCGRIHWAGTESSAVMCGWVDGAVRSGERAASEVMQRELVSTA